MHSSWLRHGRCIDLSMRGTVSTLAPRIVGQSLTIWFDKRFAVMTDMLLTRLCNRADGVSDTLLARKREQTLLSIDCH